jgi:hypothetical protein
MGVDAAMPECLICFEGLAAHAANPLRFPDGSFMTPGRRFRLRLSRCRWLDGDVH